ncbi:MAG: M48 family metallopeptidase [Opitutae bacterium]|jgi:Zn-dependent protease with chaperone function|nr:M48 family metallopeptidase [Opitutae bacterium]
MDFFEQQDKARSLSGSLFLLFGLAVVCIIISIFCLASVAVGFEKDLAGLAWTFELAVISSVGTIIAVFLASAFRISWLSSGGKVVAESMGGQRLNQNTKDPLARQILNVVEEMAIASGTPVPPVYLMDEEGINAFAAGYSPRDAVIGVTRGCATKLDRDQLQGVMAHEFSHILNGDMRINIRLTGIIFGIVFLASIGRILTNVAYVSGGRRRNSKDNGGGALVILGIGLLIIGGIGGFFGSMIRASISRQREFLADASAVQFTRNPDGIAGALKRIGGYSHGSKIQSAGAQEFSHMFFSSGISSMFATHPPLPIRIKRIDPNWKNSYPNTDKISQQASSIDQTSAVSGFAGASTATPIAVSSSQQQKPVRPRGKSYSARSFLKSSQSIDKEKLHQVRTVISSIPEALINQAKEPFGARCLLFAMLLDSKDQTVKNKQIEMINFHSEPGTSNETERTTTQLTKLSPEQKFILVEETRPAMAELSSRQFSNFQALMIQLIGADQSIDLFEWCMHKVIEFDFGKTHSPREQLHGRASIKSRLPECSIILGALSHHGQDGADPKPSFKDGIRALDRNYDIPVPDKESCGLSSMDQALERLNKLSAVGKRSLLDACARTIDHDGKTTDVEIQILRGISSALSCPLGFNSITSPSSA